MRTSILVASAATLMLLTAQPLGAGDPYCAVYSTDDRNIFWFVLMSDVHVGAAEVNGKENLRWMLTEAREVIHPSFIVAAGDLTDSTKWKSDGYPDGPHEEEWEAYRAVVDESGVAANEYYDLPGNHDHFGDRDFDYYRHYSLQGSITDDTQFSWTRTFDFGKYHFLGVNTCGNDGADFSMLPPAYGDNAGLEEEELRFIEESLEANQDANLTLAFGHHLLFKREEGDEFTFEELEKPTMTALLYGADRFVGLLDRYGVSMYGYGHTHTHVEEFLTKGMSEGVIYLNTASLTKSQEHQYTIVAIDNNGISTVAADLRKWPAVIITAPLDRNLGMSNDPYTSRIADTTGSSTPVRALVFDANPIESVEYTLYRIPKGSGQLVEGALSGLILNLEETAIWHPMNRVPADHPMYPYLWTADCAKPLEGGDYTVAVRAKGSGTNSDRVPTAFPNSPVNGMGCFIDALLVRE